LQHYQLLPFKRLAQLMGDLFGVYLAPGSVVNWSQVASRQVIPHMAAIRTGLEQAPVLHSDEIGLYVGGARVWLHGAATIALTCYSPHAKRRRAGIEQLGILPE
jgi:transposase